MPKDISSRKRKLIDIVRNYQHLLIWLHECLQEQHQHAEIAEYLGLSTSNYYSKRKGERRFTYEDVKKLVARLGSNRQKQTYDEFIEVRDKLYNCLLESQIPMARYRRIAKLQNNSLMTRRRDHPETWKLEDLERIGLFMESIAYCID